MGGRFGSGCWRGEKPRPRCSTTRAERRKEVARKNEQLGTNCISRRGCSERRAAAQRGPKEGVRLRPVWFGWRFGFYQPREFHRNRGRTISKGHGSKPLVDEPRSDGNGGIPLSHSGEFGGLYRQGFRSEVHRNRGRTISKGHGSKPLVDEPRSDGNGGIPLSHSGEFGGLYRQGFFGARALKGGHW